MKKELKVKYSISEVNVVNMIEKGAIESVQDYVQKNYVAISLRDASLLTENVEYIATKNELDIFYCSKTSHYYICEETDKSIGDPNGKELQYEDIQNLRAVLSTLDPGSMLHSSLSRTVNFLVDKTIFLFGSDIVKALQDEGLDGAINQAIDDDSSYDVKEHFNYQHPIELIDKASGWFDYAILDHSEYKEFKRKTQ